jgi:ornithine cyclodeaminase
MDAPAFLDAAAVAERLPFGPLVDTLADAFRRPVETPLRIHGDLGVPTGAAAEQRDLLVMPAWVPGGEIGVKLVTLFEHNDARGVPRIQGLYLLFDAETGTPVALLDAAALTTRRTAAASALAARFLCRADASSLLVCGSGRLARALPEAHACVRPLQRVRVWARREDGARETVADLRRALPDLDVAVAPDLERAVREADIVSSAVPSRDAFLRGAWLAPGAHLDLIGSYRPDMHEADAQALVRATRFVDTRAGVLAEAGEFIDALAAGVLPEPPISADLGELVAGVHPGRTGDDEITLFKSVGTALEDLAAARLAVAGAG